MTRSTDAEDAGVEPVEADAVDVERVRDALTSPDGLERDEAAGRCLALAEADVEALRPLAPDLVARLDDGNVNVQLKALAALHHLAEPHPADLADATGALCALLTHEVPRVQYSAAQTVQTLGVEHPEWFVDETDPLLAVLEADVVDPTADGAAHPAGDAALRQQLERVGHGEQFQQHTVRAIAGNLLVEVSRRDPAAVVDDVGRLRDLLGAEDLNVAACAAEVLGNAAQADAEAVRPARAALLDALDGEGEAVVAQAIRALGFLDDAAAVDALRGVAGDESRAAELRSLADDTVTWLTRDD